MGHRPLGRSWFRPEKVQATSSFASQYSPPILTSPEWIWVSRKDCWWVYLFLGFVKHFGFYQFFLVLGGELVFRENQFGALCWRPAWCLTDLAGAFRPVEELVSGSIRAEDSVFRVFFWSSVAKTWFSVFFRARTSYGLKNRFRCEKWFF